MNEKIREMSMTEFEENVIAEGGIYSERVLKAREILNSLPPKKVEYGKHGWCRCFIACNKCGREEASAILCDWEEGTSLNKEHTCWCTICGEITKWIPKYRIER